MSDPASFAVPVRDAATLVLVRHSDGVPCVLMGQRGSKAVFMPGKYVFPGGRVDRGDAQVPLGRLDPATERALHRRSAPIAGALAAAAIRELWEETGLALGRPGEAPPPPGWEAFFARGLVPEPAPLRFFFRAVTPPGRPRRFDARFFLCDASAVAGDLDDFSAAGDELAHLHWLSLARARDLDLPFVTRIALSELAARLAAPHVFRPVPFFDHSDGGSRFHAL